jgi:hypothetical protein
VGELVEHVEHPVPATIVGAILDEVIGPDMIALLRPQPNARSIGQPEPAALGLLMRDLQPLALPDTLDPLSLFPVLLRDIPCFRENRELRSKCLNRLELSTRSSFAPRSR